VIEFAVRQRIAASPERVFAAIVDLDRWHEWLPDLVRIERLSDGPLRVGSRWREVRRSSGGEGMEVYEVTGLEPGRSLELYVDGKQGSSRRGAYRFQHVVDRRDRETQHLVAVEVEGLGIGGRLFRRQLEKAIARDQEALKRYLERPA
jgi:uncharacterized protein YndB with AHSA1/START domain